MKIGFIGLGNIGSAMAMNLLNAGHNLTVYNRTAQKAKPLVDQGAHAAANPAEASRAEVVFTMLADDHAVESVTFGESGILETLQPGSIHISSSTISVALSQKLAAAHEKHNQQFISAPVFGRPEAAAAGKLIVVVAGRTDAIDRCTPLFEVIGQHTFRFGAQPSGANLIKLSGTFLIASVLESLSEAMALVGKAGIDQHEYVDFLTSTLFAAPVYKTMADLSPTKEISTCRLCGTARSERCSPHARGRRAIARSTSARQPDSRPFFGLARPRGRHARLVRDFANNV